MFDRKISRSKFRNIDIGSLPEDYIYKHLELVRGRAFRVCGLFEAFGAGHA